MKLTDKLKINNMFIKIILDYIIYRAIYIYYALI